MPPAPIVDNREKTGNQFLDFERGQQKTVRARGRNFFGIDFIQAARDDQNRDVSARGVFVSGRAQPPNQLHRAHAAECRIDQDQIEGAQAKDFQRLQPARDRACPESADREPFAQKECEILIVADDQNVRPYGRAPITTHQNQSPCSLWRPLETPIVDPTIAWAVVEGYLGMKKQSNGVMERIVVRVRRAARGASQDISPEQHLDTDDAETKRLSERYLEHFQLGAHPLWLTTDRRAFQVRLGRRVDAGIGGAFVYHPHLKTHLILINLPRIDRSAPKALEIVVAEELMHMRDWLDGDRRRHSKHGYDRIAFRVAELTGATIDEVRSCLLPRARRPMRYLYRCPGCSRTVQRRTRGTWSCARCSPVFDRRFVLKLERDLVAAANPRESVVLESTSVDGVDRRR